MESSAPTIMRSRVRIPSTTSSLISIYIDQVESICQWIGMWKERKEAGIGPYFLKKRIYRFLPSTPAWQRPRIHFNYVNEWRCRIKQVKSRLLWQCGQIWRNFATMAEFYKSLAIFEAPFNILQKLLQVFVCIWAIFHFCNRSKI